MTDANEPSGATPGSGSPARTPGPWAARTFEKVCFDIYAAEGSIVVGSDGCYGEANALLIAAAPAMLDEIAHVIDTLDPEMARCEIVQLRERLIRLKSALFQ